MAGESGVDYEVHLSQGAVATSCLLEWSGPDPETVQMMVDWLALFLPVREHFSNLDALQEEISEQTRRTPASMLRLPAIVSSEGL